jgi:hypothetical protein
MDKFVVITRNSVYTVVSTATGNYVTGRATFDSRSVLPTDQLLSGKVKVDAEVGGQMVFLDPILGPVTTSTVLMVIAL